VTGGRAQVRRSWKIPVVRCFLGVPCHVWNISGSRNAGCCMSCDVVSPRRPKKWKGTGWNKQPIPMSRSGSDASQIPQNTILDHKPFCWVMLQVAVENLALQHILYAHSPCPYTGVLPTPKTQGENSLDSERFFSTNCPPFLQWLYLQGVGAILLPSGNLT
jgi:hypothetical protein